MPRFLAWLIDLAAISIIHSIVSQEIVGPGFYFLFTTDGNLGPTTDAFLVQVWRILAVGAVELLLVVGLFAAFIRTLRATPGQRLSGLLTVTSEGGLQLSWGQAVGRCLMLYGPWVAILALPPFLAVGLDTFDPAGELAWVSALPWLVRAAALVWYLALAIASSRPPDERGFHDLATRSVVVRRAP
jgi:hypothetical protein